MPENPINPPKWADRFLSWYCNPKLLEQIQGDVHELFYWRLEEGGASQAKRSFVWDVVRLFRWSNIKRSSKSQKLSQMGIIKSYFKIGVRNLWKQRVSSAINSIGLALAIGCCLVAYKFIEKDFVKDQFHKNKDRIHLVTPVKLIHGTPRRFAWSGPEIINSIEDKISGLEGVIRYQNTFAAVKTANKTFAEEVSFVDENFLEFFSFDVLYGEEAPLSDRSGIVISDRLAEKCFGTEYPIGKSLNVNIGGEQQDFLVSAVIRDRQYESSLRMQMLINFNSIPALKNELKQQTYTFIYIPDNLSKVSVSDQLGRLTEGFPQEQSDLYKTISMVPFSGLMKLKEGLVGNLVYGVNYEGMIIVGAIALFMLTLAIFNYINIATVMAMARIKEIGVRKVVGSTRSQLILQFLTENFMLCLFTIISGLLLAKAFFLPWFSLITSEEYFIDILTNYRIWLFLVSLLLFITVVSGIYPAFFAARLKPTAIFQNASSKRSKHRLTNVLLGVQLTLALITLINALMFVYTDHYNKSSGWGFDRSSLVAVSNIPKEEVFAFRNKVESMSIVQETSMSSFGIKSLGKYPAVQSGNFRFSTRDLLCDLNYAETLGFKLLKGRFLDENTIEDKKTSIVVNQEFMEKAGFESVNSKVEIDSTMYTVVGVVEDFVQVGFSSPISPVMMRYGGEEMRHLTVKALPSDIDRLEAELNGLTSQFENSKSTLVLPMTNIFDNHFEEAKLTQNMMVFTASLAILLAAMGIFGVVSLSIKNRIKLFGIKKVLGATTVHLYKDVYRPFGVILSVAFILGAGAATVLVTPLLQIVYANHPSINWVVFLVGLLILTIVVVLTVNTQLRKLVRLNPVETLRDE